MNVNDLKHGDLVFVNNKSTSMLFNLFLNMIRWGTHSDYTHVAIIVQNPTFGEKPLQGTYVWQSTYEGKPDPQDNKIKLGVQLTELDDFLDHYKNVSVFVRRFSDISLFTDDKLREAHMIAYDKLYDIYPKDWIEAFVQKDPNPQKTERFWCSAFVGFVLTKIGILQSDTDWSIMRPCDFALDGEDLRYAGDTKLEPVEYKLLH
tara:strand:+ start:171 stop:782 length:612 start_codon:yes stop_codon:yes gene_type:complete